MQKGLIGFSQRKSVFIISSKPELVAEKILQKMDRGFTYFHASGGYAGGEKRVIYTVINLLELGRLKEYLFEYSKSMSNHPGTSSQYKLLIFQIYQWEN